MRDTLLRVGKIIFAVPFVIFGILHFIAATKMAGVVPAWLPGGIFWVYFTGALLIAGGVGIMTERMRVQAAYGVAALMATFIVTVHFPALSNEGTRQMAMMGLLKELALIGGAITIANVASPHSTR
jgi:uncharacterized membrane protein